MDTEQWKTKYYYLRVPDSRQEEEEEGGKRKSRGIPIVCVCLVQDERVARGVAVCSEQDQCCKRVGRGIARQRAIHALVHETTGLEIEAIDKFPWAALGVLGTAGIVYKVEYDPELSEFEKKLLKE